MSPFDPIAAARKIASDSLRDDPLNPFDRLIAGNEAVRITLPMKDPQALRVHLQMLARTCSDCLAIIEQSGRRDRGILLDVRGRLRHTNSKITAYRKIRN